MDHIEDCNSESFVNQAEELEKSSRLLENEELSQQLIPNHQQQAVATSTSHAKRKRVKNIITSDSEEEEIPIKPVTKKRSYAISYESERGEKLTELIEQPIPNINDEYDSSDSFIDNEDAVATSDTDDEDYESDEYQPPDPGMIMTNNSKLKEIVSKRKKSLKQGKRVTKDFKDDTQEVSIHKINMNHLKFNKLENKPDKIIDFIMKQYDQPKGKKNNGYIEADIPDSCFPNISPSDEEYFEGPKFEIRVFSQIVLHHISLLKSYGVHANSQTVHSLIFHYRKNEIFALTTNQSWNVVNWCSDTKFPCQIAARILSEDGPIESTKKGLVGTDLLQKTTHKHDKKSNPFDSLQFVQNYTAEIRMKASILRLSCFKKNGEPSGNRGVLTTLPNKHDKRTPQASSSKQQTKTLQQPKGTLNKEPNVIQGVKVTVNLGGIRIHKRFCTSDFLSLLSDLSIISNGKKTFDLNGNVEQNSTAHVHYLSSSEVPPEEGRDLNLCLSKLIHDAIADDRKLYIMENFHLNPRHTRDFFNANYFVLYFKKVVVTEWYDRAPSMKDVILALKNTDLAEIRKGANEAGFLKKLSQATMAFGIKSDKVNLTNPEKLFNFVEGMYFRATDNHVYWHVQSFWYHIHQCYLFLIHKEFQDFLKNHLLTDERNPVFPKSHWPSATASTPTPYDRFKLYLETSSKFDEIWVSDEPEKELFDMIKLVRNAKGESELCIYFIVPSLNYKPQTKASRITNSIMQIKGAIDVIGQQTRFQNNVGGSEKNIESLKKMYSKIVSSKTMFKEEFPQLPIFCEKLSSATVVIAVGKEFPLKHDGTPNKSLEDERDLKIVITLEDIIQKFNIILDKNDRIEVALMRKLAEKLDGDYRSEPVVVNDEKLAKALLKRLKENDFVEESGNKITGKWLSQARHTFELTRSTSVDEFVFKIIIEPLQPQACTFLSKLELKWIRQEFNKMGINPYHILEIPFAK